MNSPDNGAAELRERQGPGARYDAAFAPTDALTWARRGTAYFARKLNELSDHEFDDPTLIPGWSRRRLIAHVGYQARALSRIVEAARTNEHVEFASEYERHAELEQGETLPHRALRHLFYHSEVHLNVEWRDLADANWDAVVLDISGEALPIRKTPFVRACAVWIHAVDLNNHGSFRDFPSEFLDALITQRTDDMDWASPDRRPELHLTDRERAPITGDRADVVKGTAADLARWLCGRGASDIIVGPQTSLQMTASPPEPIRERSRIF